MEGLSQSNKVLTSSNSAVMTQLEELTRDMGTIQAYSRTSLHQQQQEQNENTTVGYAGETYPIEARYVLIINPDTMMRNIIKKYLGTAKRGADDGYGR